MKMKPISSKKDKLLDLLKGNKRIKGFKLNPKTRYKMKEKCKVCK